MTDSGQKVVVLTVLFRDWARRANGVTDLWPLKKGREQSEYRLSSPYKLDGVSLVTSYAFKESRLLLFF